MIARLGLLIGLVLFSADAMSVTGGRALVGKSHRWIVKIELPWRQGHCTGGLISSTVVVTAGHCVLLAGVPKRVEIVDYEGTEHSGKLKQKVIYTASVSDSWAGESEKLDGALLFLNRPVPPEIVDAFPQVVSATEREKLKSLTEFSAFSAGVGNSSEVGTIIDWSKTGEKNYLYFKAASISRGQRLLDKIAVFRTKMIGDWWNLTDGKSSLMPGDSGAPVLAEIDGSWRWYGVLSVGYYNRWQNFLDGRVQPTDSLSTDLHRILCAAHAESKRSAEELQGIFESHHCD